MASAAQEEFDDLVAKNTARETLHPEDRDDRDRDYDDEDEETAYRNSKIDAAMRGVIADARSFQTARRSKWVDRAKSARSSIFGLAGVTSSNNNVGSGGSSRSESETDEDARSADNSDEETFLQEWRETRRRELESESGREVRNRRTSPSVRLYGRLDEVDALGYLDAIEKVRRETKVVVFVYDNEVLRRIGHHRVGHPPPLVKENPEVHFVKVHYDDIEFDPAAVPSLLAYRNQGDLFANLTGIIEMMPDDDSFDSGSLKHILQAHAVL
ncbi:hypothetical protein ACCO45_008835 [Purpureocillium lilacinum]|uniref:Uncharacterized protein n=1 Tax=Purpureocillium lilacinum TaxID=33203 RepID=A0ACC4DJF4_PURLI